MKEALLWWRYQTALTLAEHYKAKADEHEAAYEQHGGPIWRAEREASGE